MVGILGQQLLRIKELATYGTGCEAEWLVEGVQDSPASERLQS